MVPTATTTAASPSRILEPPRSALWKAREDFWFTDGDVLIVTGSGGRIAFWDWDSWNARPTSGSTVDNDDHEDDDDAQSDENTLCEGKEVNDAPRSSASASFLVHSAVLNRAGSSTFCSSLGEASAPPDSDDEGESEGSSGEEDGEEDDCSVLDEDEGEERVDPGYDCFGFDDSESAWEQEAGLSKEDDLVEVIRVNDDPYDIECLLNALYFGINPTCSYSFLDATLRISQKYDMSALYGAARQQMSVLYGSSTAPLMAYDPLDQWEKGIFDDDFDDLLEDDQCLPKRSESESKTGNLLSATGIPFQTPPLPHSRSRELPQPMPLPAPIAFY